MSTSFWVYSAVVAGLVALPVIEHHFFNKKVQPDEIPENVPFGVAMRPFFCINPKEILINHGSYGSPPRYVVKKCNEYRSTMELNTDRWFRFTAEPLLKKTIAALCEFVNVKDPNDVVLVENASVAVNSVLRSFPFAAGDRIAYFSIAYGMVKETLYFLRDRFKVELVEIPVTVASISAGKQGFVNHVASFLEKEQNIKMFVMDHITSTPAILLPVKELVALCKKHNIVTFIDGAHVVGQVPLDLTDIDPDMYLSNCHKWLYSPKGGAFLYVHKKYQSTIHPAVVSFGYKKGLQEEFKWTGTRDMSSLLAISDALHFRAKLGNAKIFNYMHNYAVNVGAMVAKLWHTNALPIDKDMVPAMVNVRFPCNDPVKVEALANKLLKDYGIWMQTFVYEQETYVRFSCQIYNSQKDYVDVAAMALKLLQQ